MRTSIFPAFLEELEARQAIETAIKSNCSAIDRAAGPATDPFHPANDLFHEDAQIEVSEFKGRYLDFLPRRENAHVIIEHSVHFISNISIKFATPRLAAAETFLIVVHKLSSRHPLVQPNMAGGRGVGFHRYVDKFERRGDDSSWRIVHRRLVTGDGWLEQIPQDSHPSERPRGAADPVFALQRELGIEVRLGQAPSKPPPALNKLKWKSPL